MSARSWETYVVVLLSGFLSLLVPFCMAFLSRALRVTEKRRTPPAFVVKGARDKQSSNVSALGERMNFRFFLAVNASLALLGLVLLLIPIVGVFHASAGSGRFMAGLGICSISALLGVALLYAGKKGDLSWLSPLLRRRERG